MSKETHFTDGKVWMTKPDFIKEHERLVDVLKSGPDYEDQKDELEEAKGVKMFGKGMDSPAEENKDIMDVKKICGELKKLIEKERSEGDTEDADKLQKALDICEEMEEEEETEGGSDKSEAAEKEPKKSPFPKKSSFPKANAATMPMDQLRAKINPPNLNSY